MNCKQGDLAIIVRSHAGNEGNIVRAIRWAGKVSGLVGDDRWEVDITMPTMRGNTTNTAQDSNLRPIRPDSEPTSFESHRELEAA